MVKTFIYGVPHGFDFYEKEASLNNYFKGFYISSRSGRRLEINRRDNGETIYSYLRYGLKEVDRQPLHSFFGMSLMLDNYQFCPNFKILLEWFDFLFDKFVNEHNIIKRSEDGVLHYVVHRFDENASDIKWLKSNLPNILTEAGQTQIISYDSSFLRGKPGEIVSVKQPVVGDNRLLEMFKSYRGLSISSEIVERQDEGPTPLQIELNHEELNEKLQGYNQSLLRIAVNFSKDAEEILKRMDKEIDEIRTSLVVYLPTINDCCEIEKFKRLKARYDSLKESIKQLLDKIPPAVLPETQYCSSCKQQKILSQFRSSNATTCIECEGSKPAPGPKPRKKKGFLGGMTILIGIAVAVIVVNLPKGEQNNSSKIDKQDGVIMEAPPISSDKILDTARFKELIALNEFEEAYEYIKNTKGKDDNHKKLLKDIFQNHLTLRIRDGLTTTEASSKDKKEEKVLELLGRVYLKKDFLEYIGFDKQNQELFQEFVKDYYFLLNLNTKKKFSNEEKKELKAILSPQKYGDKIPKDLRDKLLEKMNNDSKTIETSVSYTYKDRSDQYQSGQIKEKRSKTGVDVLKGSKVTVSFPNSNIKVKKVDKNEAENHNGKAEITIKEKVIVYCGEIEITFTPIDPKFDE